MASETLLTAFSDQALTGDGGASPLTYRIPRIDLRLSMPSRRSSKALAAIAQTFNAASFVLMFVPLPAVQLPRLVLIGVRVGSAVCNIAGALGYGPMDLARMQKEKEDRQIEDHHAVMIAFHRDSYVRELSNIPASELDDPAKVRLSLLSDHDIREHLPVSHQAEALKTQIMLALGQLKWTSYPIRSSWFYKTLAMPDENLHTEEAVGKLWELRELAHHMLRPKGKKERNLAGRIGEAVEESAKKEIRKYVKKLGHRIAEEVSEEALLRKAAKLKTSAGMAVALVDAYGKSREALDILLAPGVAGSEEELVMRMAADRAVMRYEIMYARWAKTGRKSGDLPSKSEKNIDVRLGVEVVVINFDDHALLEGPDVRVPLPVSLPPAHAMEQHAWLFR